MQRKGKIKFTREIAELKTTKRSFCKILRTEKTGSRYSSRRPFLLKRTISTI